MKEYLPESDTGTYEQLRTKYVGYMADGSVSRYIQDIPPAYSGNDESNSLFQNYVHPSDYPLQFVQGTVVEPYTTLTNNPVPHFFNDATKALTESLTVSVDGKKYTYYPYIPGLSDSIMTTNNSNGNIKGYPESEISSRVAGVDCVGLVQRAHAYEGSYYSALKTSSADVDKYRHDPVYWTGGTIPTSARDYFHGQTYNKEIVNYNESKDGDSDPVKVVKVFEKLKYVVPGDVVYYNGHIMVVGTINTASGPDGNFRAKDIIIIESVYHKGDNVYGAVKERTIQKITDHNKEWHVWREQ